MTLTRDNNITTGKICQIGNKQHHLPCSHHSLTFSSSAISETTRLLEEQMKNSKGQVCSLILEKQRKIASLESDSSSLILALELIDQERINLSSKLIEKSTYYIKVREDVNAKLQQQQVKDSSGEKRGKASFDNHLSMGNQGNDARKNLMNMLDSAKAKLDKKFTNEI